MAAGMIDQDTAHQLGGDGEKVCAILPMNALAIDKPQVRFIDHRRRLQRVAGMLSAHVVVSQASQLVINQRH